MKLRFSLLAMLLTASTAMAQTSHPTTVGKINLFGSKKAATASAAAPTNPITAIQTITVADLTNALSLANGQTNLPSGVVQPPPYNSTVTGGDTRHGNCWAALIQFANGIQTQNILPNQMGLATLQQTIFDDQQLVGRPLLPDYVVTNCALTLNDANMNFIQLTTALGVKAITLPKLPF